jgi:hypothetical protein
VARTSFSWLYASASRAATQLAKKSGSTTSPASAETQILFQLLLLESKPVSDLFPEKGDLTNTVANIKDRRSMFGLYFTCDGKRTVTRSRNGTASFATTRQSVMVSKRLSERHMWTHVDMEVNDRMPRIGQPSSRAVLADVRMCIPTP